VAARLKQLKIGVDAPTEARLSERAGLAGATVSEYVRALILRDLAGGAPPSPSEPPLPSALTGQLLELPW
jgi:hypothetical protein